MRLLLLSSFIKMYFHLSKVQLSFYPTTSVVLFLLLRLSHILWLWWRPKNDDDDESKQESGTESWRKEMLFKLFAMFLFILLTFSLSLITSCKKKSPNKSKSFVKTFFLRPQISSFCNTSTDCLASYATETVMQYCHGRRRVCRWCSLKLCQWSMIE